MTPIKASEQIVIRVPAEDAWKLISDVGAYRYWWPRSLGIRVLEQGDGLIGTTVEIRPRKGRSFSCRVIAAEPPHRIELAYFGGFIEGRGEWTIAEVEGGTRIGYSLDAQAHGWLAGIIGRFKDLGEIHAEQMHEVFLRLRRMLVKDAVEIALNLPRPPTGQIRILGLGGGRKS